MCTRHWIACLALGLGESVQMIFLSGWRGGGDSFSISDESKLTTSCEALIRHPCTNADL